MYSHRFCAVLSSRTSSKTQSPHYTPQTPIPPSEHKRAWGNTTNSDSTLTAVSFLLQPTILTQQPAHHGSTQALRQTLPSVQAPAPAPSHNSRCPSRLTTISHRTCSQTIQYWPTTSYLTRHLEIQVTSAPLAKRHIGCFCSARYPAFSQSSRTFFFFIHPLNPADLTLFSQRH